MAEVPLWTIPSGGPVRGGPPARPPAMQRSDHATRIRLPLHAGSIRSRGTLPRRPARSRPGRRQHHAGPCRWCRGGVARLDRSRDGSHDYRRRRTIPAARTGGRVPAASRNGRIPDLHLPSLFSPTRVDAGVHAAVAERLASGVAGNMGGTRHRTVRRGFCCARTGRPIGIRARGSRGGAGVRRPDRPFLGSHLRSSRRTGRRKRPGTARWRTHHRQLWLLRGLRSPRRNPDHDACGSG